MRNSAHAHIRRISLLARVLACLAESTRMSVSQQTNVLLDRFRNGGCYDCFIAFHLHACECSG